MTKTNRNRFTGILLTCMLCFSLVIPVNSFAETKSDEYSIEQPVKLQGAGSKQNTLSNAIEADWYQFDPKTVNLAKNSHLRLTLTSNAPVQITVYANKDKADNNETFYNYQAFADQTQSAEVDFPYAWDNPYYIQVTGFEDEAQENTGPITYQLHYESVNLPPATGADEDCAVELSLGQKKAGNEIIKYLRQIRDEVLRKSEKGKKLTELYYQASPFLVAKMTFNQQAKNTVYNNLVQLEPAIASVFKKGAHTDYHLTKTDQQAIQQLYDFTLKAAPQHIKDKISKLITPKDVAQLQGITIKQAMKNLELSGISSSNKVIIKLKPGKNRQWLSQKITATGFKAKKLSTLASKSVSLPGIFVTQVDEKSINSLMKKLKHLPEVEFVERVQSYHALAADVQYPYQWSLSNAGQEGGKPNADIKYTALQKLLHDQKLRKTLIAVADTGVDSSLADLKRKVRTDLGKNFIAKNNDTNDDEGHGTHVSGIIAANADNNYSTAGLNRAAQILPVKILDAYGEGETDQIALGIKYAADKGAKVINLSLGGYYSRTIEYALKYAASKNVVIVAASGNSGFDELDYPASSKYAIAVGATNRLDITADYSSYGNGLALVAPGSDIPSLLPNGNVTYMSGTSMAAPHVSAVAGMLLSKNPKLTPKQVTWLLTKTADNVAMKENDKNMQECYNDEGDQIPCSQKPGHDYVSGSGRLNAFSAISAVELKMKAGTFKDNMITLSGKAQKGTSITVQKGKQVLGKTTANTKGTFNIKLSKTQRANTVLQVKGQSGLAKTSMKLIVQTGKTPPAPKVKLVSNKSTAVTGTTLSDLKVVVKNKSKKVVASGKANNKGKFNFKIKKQKAGTTLYVTVTDLAKRQSKATKVVVADKIPPKAPRVSKITNRDTVLKGKTETSATIIVKQKGKQIATKKADRKGNFKVKIKRQKTGAILYVTSKDRAGNISKATKVIVKK